MLSNFYFLSCITLVLIILQSQQIFAATNRVIKLGMVYDPTGVYINAYRGYQFYIHKINSKGGLSVGSPGHVTNYTFTLIAHSIVNITDPYWEQTSKFHIILYIFILLYLFYFILFNPFVLLIDL